MQKVKLGNDIVSDSKNAALRFEAKLFEKHQKFDFFVFNMFQ
jgi:hypothetical protein